MPHGLQNKMASCRWLCQVKARFKLMETRTVKPPKALPNMFRKVMPTLVVANKHSQDKKDLGDPKDFRFHIAHSLLVSMILVNCTCNIYHIQRFPEQLPV